MPKKTPTLSVLELFLLALIAEGVNSIYQLHSRARLSVGATHPALKRLVQLRLVKRDKTGTRARQTYAITSRGVELLSGEWNTLINLAPAKPYADAESVLRLVAMADRGRDSNLAADLLRRAIADRQNRSKAPSVSPSTPGTADRYVRFLEVLTAGRLKSEATAFEAVRRAMIGKLS